MRRTIGRLAATTGVALAIALLTATPADARRNVGGVTPGAEDCVQPSGVLVSDQASTKAPCVCVVTPAGVVRNVGRDPSAECPPGVLGREDRPDRNVGG